MAAAPLSRQPAFYYELSDPWSYLVAERILGELPVMAEWQPVLGSQLGWVAPEVDSGRLAAAVAEQGLLPLRLPSPWPADSRLAMLACAFAKGGGRSVAFSLAAFRQAFAAGRDLGDESTVVIAAAACEMHPRSVLKAVRTRAVAGSLQRAGERARAAGVGTLPAIDLGDGVFEGAGALDAALTALSAGGVRSG